MQLLQHFVATTQSPSEIVFRGARGVDNLLQRTFEIFGSAPKPLSVDDWQTAQVAELHGEFRGDQRICWVRHDGDIEVVGIDAP